MLLYQSILSNELIEFEKSDLLINRINNIGKIVDNVKGNLGFFISNWYAEKLNALESAVSCNLHPNFNILIGVAFFPEAGVKLVVLKCCCDKFKEEVYIESHKMRATIK